MLLLLCFVLQEDEDSSTSLEDDDDGASVEEVLVVVDKIIVSEVATVEATATVEPADSVIAVAETTGDTATILVAFEEEVIAAEVAAEMDVEEPEGAVTTGIAGGDRLAQGGSSRSGDYVDSTLLD